MMMIEAPDNLIISLKTAELNSAQAPRKGRASRVTPTNLISPAPIKTAWMTDLKIIQYSAKTN